MKLIRISELENILGVGKRTILSWHKAGLIELRLLNNRWFITQDELDRFLAARKEVTA